VAASSPFSTPLSGILERGILDLIIKVAALVMTYVVGTNVFVAGKLGRLGLVAESVKECLGDALLETDAGKGCNDLLANILREGFVANAEHIRARPL
jgi:hypothetical protein